MNKESHDNETSIGMTGRLIQDDAADALEDAAEGVARGGRRVRRRLADVGDRAESAIDSAADYIRDREPSAAVAEVGAMARRNPALAIAAAAVLGFFLGRVVTNRMNA